MKTITITVIVIILIIGTALATGIATIKITETEKTQQIIELEKANLTKKNLQNTYDELLEDALGCYWATICTNEPTQCKEHYAKVDATIEELQEYYLERCYKINEKWDKYIETETQKITTESEEKWI